MGKEELLVKHTTLGDVTTSKRDYVENTEENNVGLRVEIEMMPCSMALFAQAISFFTELHIQLKL